MGSQQTSYWELHEWAVHRAAVDTEELPAACVRETVPSCPHGTHFLPVTLQFKGAMHVPFVFQVCTLVF